MSNPDQVYSRTTILLERFNALACKLFELEALRDRVALAERRTGGMPPEQRASGACWANAEIRLHLKSRSR